MVYASGGPALVFDRQASGCASPVEKRGAVISHGFVLSGDYAAPKSCFRTFMSL